MAIELCSILDKSNHIPVDKWDTEEYPVDQNDRIFRTIRGEIILPITEFFYGGDEEKSSLNYFVMNTRKRTYNSVEMRDHICRYLNYFEKFYDKDKELLMVLYNIKLTIDYMEKYTMENFVDDVNRYIIRNPNITIRVQNFVEDNYLIHLRSNNRTPNLQFEDKHAKILYEISLYMNMYIPLCTHYMYIHNIRESADIKRFMRTMFDLCEQKYLAEKCVDIYNKIYEIAANVTNKSKNTDKILWEKNLIRGNNPITHIEDSVNDVILNIIPKYSFEKNVINFVYFSNRKLLNYKITDIAYEYQFSKLSSSKRDDEQNSEYDRYEALLNKKDEAIILQNKVAANQVVERAESLYGPFSPEEIAHYKKKLTHDNNPVINNLQRQLIGYMFYKDFGDPMTMYGLKNQESYIKLLIAAKRILLKNEMVMLPYILSSRVLRVASRKIINKKDNIRIENSLLYRQLQEKYKNPKIEERIKELIAVVVSSSYEIIDWDDVNKCPSDLDGITIPIVNDLVTEEMILFISLI